MTALLHYPECGAALPNGCYKHNWAVSTRCHWPPGAESSLTTSPPRGAVETLSFWVRLASTALEFSMNSILFIRPVYLKAFPTLGQPYLLHF